METHRTNETQSKKKAKINIKELATTGWGDTKGVGSHEFR